VTDQKPQHKSATKFRLAGMGMELAGAVVGGCLIGYWVDYQFKTRYGLITGALLGIFGGMYNLLKQSLKIVREEQKQSNEPKNDLGPSN